MPQHYKIAAESGMQVIRQALALAGRSLASIGCALDYACGCGYRRVQRLVTQALPHAQVHACDVVPQAVDFCAKEFGVTAFTVPPDPARVRPPRQYDLIWVGSLLSHLRQNNFQAMLSKLASALAPNGVLAMTTHGRFSLKILAVYGLPLPSR